MTIIWIHENNLDQYLGNKTRLNDDTITRKINYATNVKIENSHYNNNTAKILKRINEKHLMLLNVTTSDQIASNHQSQKYSIDVLTVGTMYNMPLAQTQFETWGSHPIIRNYFLATEFDDPDVHCHATLKLDDVREISKTCKKKQFWSSKGLSSPLTDNFAVYFARIQWLEKKRNPAGWVCAQKRFISAFTKLMDLYINKNNTQEEIFPDYLVIVDDDTYINIEHIKNYLLSKPSVKVPPPTEPVIFSGCRVRWPNHQVKFTFPWGGFGTFLSKGSLQRWVQPINCKFSYSNSSSNEFERNICNKYLKKNSNHVNLTYPHSATIGEERYFKNGDSLNNVFSKFIRNEVVCLHSDWFYGYFSNFLNLSVHVNYNFKNSTKDPTSTAEWFDKYNNESIVPENRLHTIMESDVYKKSEGLCGEPCHNNSAICHNIYNNRMKSLYNESRLITPYTEN